MADQIVITEKTSQAKDVRAAVGSRYGDILPAEGHLLDLLEPEDVVPAWKRWSPILLRPEGLYGTCPAEGGNKAAKLKAIREALRTAKALRVPRPSDASTVHRAGLADHPRRIRSGKAKFRIRSPLRRRRGPAPGRPDLQPVAHPHRNRHLGSRGAEGHRCWPREDADFGHRLQARAGDPELRANRLL